jgi:hypothetical protein
MQGATPAERPALDALTEQQEKALRKALLAQRNKVFAIHATRGVHEHAGGLPPGLRRLLPLAGGGDAPEVFEPLPEEA